MDFFFADTGIAPTRCTLAFHTYNSGADIHIHDILAEDDNTYLRMLVRSSACPVLLFLLFEIGAARSKVAPRCPAVSGGPGTERHQLMYVA